VRIISRLFDQLTPSRLLRPLTRGDMTRGNLPEKPLHGIPELPNEHDLMLVGQREHDRRPRMPYHLPLDFDAARLDDTVDVQSQNTASINGTMIESLNTTFFFHTAILTLKRK
jgi:hypothetical protein